MGLIKHQLYSGKCEVVFDQERHLYTIDGVPATGVTTVLGVIAKPALILWAAKETATACREAFNRALAEQTNIDRSFVEAVCEAAKNTHRKKKETAGTIGHIVHSWIEAHINEPEVEHDFPASAEAVSGCKAFLDWEKAHAVEFLASERVVASRAYGYCGTLDFTAMVDGKRTLGDIKTGSGIYDEFFFQTAAYELALREEGDSPFDEHLIVNCKKTRDLDGNILEIKSSAEFEANSRAFIAALTLFRRIEALKKIKKI